MQGVPPHTIAARAIDSVDPDGPYGALQVRWDIDADGTWDTPFSTDLQRNFTLYVPGRYPIRAQLRDADGATAAAQLEQPVRVRANPSETAAAGLPERLANIDVDSNRDGRITVGDDVGEDEWRDSHGAIFIANANDDDSDGQRDARDDRVNGANDVRDLLPIVVRGTSGIEQNHTAYLRVRPESAAAAVRVFAGSTPDAMRPLPSAANGRLEVDPESLVAGDQTLYLEAGSGRSGEWDGTVELAFELRDASELVSRDYVQIRAAPVVFPDNLRAAKELFVMRIERSTQAPNLPFYEALQEHLPEAVALYTVAGPDYGWDRWLQDNMQGGYQTGPARDGPRALPTALQTARDGDLFGLLPEALLSPEVGYLYPGGNDSSQNYGGNIEVAPPHTTAAQSFPLGRLVIGGGDGGTLLQAPAESRMTAPQRSWLAAQEIQGPVLELASEWLYVGHIDEVFLFIPNPSQDNGRAFKVLFASPSLAWGILEDLATSGYGDTAVFAGRGDAETTVRAVYEDSDLATYQQLAQQRIDQIRVRLSTAMGLDDDDIVEVPVLYEPIFVGDRDFATAYSPGIQNLTVVDDVLFVPDPEGPRVGGEDVFKKATTEALRPLGVTLHYVDVFESYHVLYGEAHCGTNVRRGGYDTVWWEHL